MANTNKFVVKNGLETQNIDFLSTDGTNLITATMEATNTLSFSGTSGELFSVKDDLTGTVTAPGVNISTGELDLAGLRALSKNSNWLYVNGSTEFTSGVYVGSNMQINGTTRVDGSINFSGANPFTGSDVANWNTAFGWGDHSVAGYTGNQTAGIGLSGTTTLALDLGELTAGGTLIAGDYLIAENGGADHRQLISSIPLSIFNNDSGWTSTTGTVDTSGTPVANDFARFTDANTVAGRSYSEVKTDLSLGNVTNTSDANKPVSTAQQTALDLKANLASPTFTGTITAGKFTQSGSSGNDFYGASFTRSNTGTTTPDVWGANNTFVIGTTASLAAVSFSGTSGSELATFPGDVAASGGDSADWNTAFGWGDHSTAGYITGTGNTTGYAGTLLREDNRIVSPSEGTVNRLKFGFGSWDNDNTSPYADFLHLRSYNDASGGADNLVAFKKSGIGMRIWQQTFGSATAYASYEDVWDTGTLTTTNKANYDTAFGWGDHSVAGYTGNQAAGTGLTGTTTLSLDFDELGLGGTLVGTDHLIASNNGVENRQLISSIPLSIFNNDSGWTSTPAPSTTAYDATSWDANGDAASKNAIRDKIVTMDAAIALNTAKVTNSNQTAGIGLSGTTTLALDLGELTAGGTLIAGDYLIAENGGADHRQLISSIPLSIFNNDSGWTSTPAPSTTAYNATSWDANTDAASKNAIRDKIVAMDAAIALNTAKETNTIQIAGVGLSGTATLALDFSELSDMTADISGTTEFIVQNSTTESRKAASEIKLSNFNNDSGWTSATGTVDTSGTPVANDFARFTDANTVAGRSYSEVKTDLSLGNVTNTSDANKPVSTAQQTALDLKANLASPTFTGSLTLSSSTIAGAGTTQGGGTAITTTHSIVTSGVADSGARLPAAVAGLMITVVNATAVNIKLYPATSDTINSGTLNAAISIPAGSSSQLVGVSATDWKTLVETVIYNESGVRLN